MTCPIKKHTLSPNYVEFLIEKYKVKKKRAKTRLENNAKHEMSWIEKINTRFDKQKMNSGN